MKTFTEQVIDCGESGKVIDVCRYENTSRRGTEPIVVLETGFEASVIDSDDISTLSATGDTPQKAVIALMHIVDLHMGQGEPAR